MTGVWHFYLAARHAYANWRSRRHLDLATAWRLTAVDADRRIGR